MQKNFQFISSESLLLQTMAFRDPSNGRRKPATRFPLKRIFQHLQQVPKRYPIVLSTLLAVKWNLKCTSFRLSISVDWPKQPLSCRPKERKKEGWLVQAKYTHMRGLLKWLLSFLATGHWALGTGPECQWEIDVRSFRWDDRWKINI